MPNYLSCKCYVFITVIITSILCIYIIASGPIVANSSKLIINSISRNLTIIIVISSAGNLRQQAV
jgi:hypothetical protein